MVKRTSLFLPMREMRFLVESACAAARAAYQLARVMRGRVEHDELIEQARLDAADDLAVAPGVPAVFEGGDVPAQAQTRAVLAEEATEGGAAARHEADGVAGDRAGDDGGSGPRRRG